MMYILNLLLSMMFMLMNHPMSMGLLLLIQSIMISLITGTLTSNFWFSYIIFLIMVGGMLVLFIYMTSIASNETFNFQYNWIFLTPLMISIILLYLTMDSYFLNLSQVLTESNSFNINFNYNLIKFFNYPSIIIILMMMIYLFITLIAVVKITKIEYGPLRQFN